jgi:O-antigen/teichoic acid export membrane protein
VASWLGRLSVLAVFSDPLYRRLFSGSIWSAGGTVGAQVVRLVVSLCVARLLGKHGFGQLAMLQATSGVLVAAGSFGLGLAALRRVASHRASASADDGRVVGGCFVLVFLWSSLLVAPALLTAPLLAQHALNDASLSLELRVVCVQVIFLALDSVQWAVLVGFERFPIAARNLVLREAISLPLVLLGGWAFGLLGVVAGQAVADGLKLVINARAIRQAAGASGLVIRYTIGSKTLRMAAGYSFPAFLASTTVWISTWASNAIFVQRPGNYGELGVFQAARQWLGPIALVQGAVSQAGFPVLCHQFSSRSLTEYFRNLRAQLRSMILISGAAGAAIVGLSPLLMRSYGNDFAGRAGVLAILTAGTVIWAVSHLAFQVLGSVNRMWPLLLTGTLYAATLVGVTLGLRHWGAPGLALATTLAQLVHAVSSAFFCAKPVRTLTLSSTASLSPERTVTSAGV